MQLPSFLKPKEKAPANERKRVVNDETAVQLARTRARRRLAGAVILLAAGVLGFPLLFETQPRPIAGDIPIEIAHRDAGAAGSRSEPAPAPASAPAPDSQRRVSSSVVTETPAPTLPTPSDTPRPTPESTVPTAQPASVPSTAAAPVPRPASAPARVAAAPATSPTDRKPPAAASSPARPALDDAQRARALLDGAPSASGRVTTTTSDSAGRAVTSLPDARTTTSSSAERPIASTAPTAPTPSPPAEGASAAAREPRFVIQVGAFTDAIALREARQKVEKLGMKTYTQVIDTEGGKRTRVRVGPFATRDEAVSASTRIKGTGLPANILTL